MDPIVSIIVPVYNVENTLNRCMQSIVNQTYERIEIILVDDGSTDQSSAMCEAWKRNDNRVKVIHKANAGLGEARNTGIETATGKYFCFCDSDDYLDLITVQKCVDFAEKNDADIVHFGFVLLTSDLREKGVVRAKQEYIFSDKEIRSKFIPGMLGNGPETGKSFGVWLSLCSSFISLEVVRSNNWRCKSEREIISEDTYSLLELYSYIHTAGIIPCALYYYVENPKSLTHTFKEDRYNRIEKFYQMVKAECLELGYGAECERQLAKMYINFTMAATKQLAKANIPLFRRFSEIRKIEESELLQLLFRKKYDYSLSKRILMKCMVMKLTFASFILCRLKN